MMQASRTTPGRAAPPLWLVTNGEITVGPVSTSLLVRGVIADMIPGDCLVRESAWRHWRSVATLREVRAVRRARARFGNIALVPESERPEPFDAFATFRRHLAGERETGAVLTTLLLEVARRTEATVGAVHRRRSPYVGYVTSSVIGPGMAHRLGTVLGRGDHSIALAEVGGTLAEAPGPGAPSGHIAERLGTRPAGAGVLLAGIRRRGGLEAIVELGRADHPFRVADERAVAEAASIAACRIDEIWSLAVS